MDDLDDLWTEAVAALEDHANTRIGTTPCDGRHSETNPCPICGAKVVRDPVWDGPYTHELGWRCTQGGIGHFIQQKLARIRKNWEAHPYLIPPAAEYPGVRRDEILTTADLASHYRRMAEEGYDPTA